MIKIKGCACGGKRKKNGNKEYQNNRRSDTGKKM